MFGHGFPLIHELQTVGDTEQALAELFRSARLHAPCIIVLDQVWLGVCESSGSVCASFPYFPVSRLMCWPRSVVPVHPDTYLIDY
jgi:hypothetical protein